MAGWKRVGGREGRRASLKAGWKRKGGREGGRTSPSLSASAS
jgi:hypothetical protein